MRLVSIGAVSAASHPGKGGGEGGRNVGSIPLTAWKFSVSLNVWEVKLCQPYLDPGRRKRWECGLGCILRITHAAWGRIEVCAHVVVGIMSCDHVVWPESKYII